MNGHATAPQAKPWETLSNTLGFQNADDEFWWKYTAPVLGKFMQKAEYGLDQQYSYLSWYHNFILPALGPRPEPNKQRSWRCQVTHNASPFQPSWNLKDSKSTVRFTIEPVGHQAGKRGDPFNRKAAFELMAKLKTAMPKMEDAWFYHCAKELSHPEELLAVLKIAGPPPPAAPKPPACFVAFDLDATGIETKAYFFPHVRAKLRGMSQGRLVIDTVRGLNSKLCDMNPSLDAFEEYLNSSAPVDHTNVEMLAVDLVDPTRARAKIYVNSFNNSFNKIKEIYTMGGLIKDKPTLDSLEPLKDLWRLMFDLPEKDFEDIELPNRMHPRSCFVFGFEFKSGEALPTTKIYFPMWHYAKTDKHISEGLSAFFAKQGWKKLANSYTNDVAEIFMEDEMNTSPGTHLYLSYSANAKNKTYITMYYSPTIPHLTTRFKTCPEGEGNPMILMGPNSGRGPPPVARLLMSVFRFFFWIASFFSI